MLYPIFDFFSEPLHDFGSNFVWMFLGWTPTKFVKTRVLPLFSMELWVNLCNFCPILKKTSSIKLFIFVLERPQRVKFLVCSN